MSMVAVGSPRLLQTPGLKCPHGRVTSLGLISTVGSRASVGMQLKSARQDMQPTSKGHWASASVALGSLHPDLEEG